MRAYFVLASAVAHPLFCSWLHLRRFSGVTTLAIAAAFVCGHAAHAESLPSSVSSSRQFVVYGSDAHLRRGVCDLAERIKRNVLALLDRRDEWKTPLLIHAEHRPANLPDAPLAELNISQTGFGLKLQLNLMFGADVNVPAVEREVLRIVFLELMYRNAPNTPAGTPYVPPPDWLLDGVLALAPEGDTIKLAENLQLLAAENRITRLAEFLQQRADLLESPSRAVYRANAAALVSMLVDAEGGRGRLARFIADLPNGTNNPVADLKTHFPGLTANGQDIEETWTRTVARFASRKRFRMLSCEETERTLAKLLQIAVSNGKDSVDVYALEEFPRFVRLLAAPRVLARLREQLLLVSGHANPLYAPIIGEYQQIASLLARRKTGRIAERLARLRGDREQISRRMSRIDDYLNWYEATQAKTASGAFAEYMRAAELAAEREPRRRDPISVYLDAMEAQAAELK